MGTIVNTPVAGFTGTVAGVAFVDGRAETGNEAALAYFSRQGYQFGGGPIPGSPTVLATVNAAGPAIPDSEPSDKWKLPELKAYADREGIDLGAATKKGDVLAAIVAHLDDADDGDEPGRTDADVDDDRSGDDGDDDGEDPGDEPDRA